MPADDATTGSEIATSVLPMLRQRWDLVLGRRVVDAAFRQAHRTAVRGRGSEPSQENRGASAVRVWHLANKDLVRTWEKRLSAAQEGLEGEGLVDRSAVRRLLRPPERMGLIVWEATWPDSPPSPESLALWLELHRVIAQVSESSDPELLMADPAASLVDRALGAAVGSLGPQEVRAPLWRGLLQTRGRLRLVRLSGELGASEHALRRCRAEVEEAVQPVQLTPLLGCWARLEGLLVAA